MEAVKPMVNQETVENASGLLNGIAGAVDLLLTLEKHTTGTQTQQLVQAIREDLDISWKAALCLMKDLGWRFEQQGTELRFYEE